MPGFNCHVQRQVSWSSLSRWLGRVSHVGRRRLRYATRRRLRITSGSGILACRGLSTRTVPPCAETLAGEDGDWKIGTVTTWLGAPSDVDVRQIFRCCPGKANIDSDVQYLTWKKMKERTIDHRQHLFYGLEKSTLHAWLRPIAVGSKLKVVRSDSGGTTPKAYSVRLLGGAGGGGWRHIYAPRKLLKLCLQCLWWYRGQFTKSKIIYLNGVGDLSFSCTDFFSKRNLGLYYIV